MRLRDDLVLLAEYPPVDGPQTRCRRIDVQIGDPAWGWSKPLVHVEPAGCDPERFRMTLEHWCRHAHDSHLVTVLHVEQQGEPYALLEYCDGSSLEAVPFDRATVRTAVAKGLARLHAVGLAHGDVRPERIIATHDGRILLDLGIPWDEHATPDDDLRRAHELLG